MDRRKIRVGSAVGFSRLIFARSSARISRSSSCPCRSMRKKLPYECISEDIARSRASFRAPPLFPRGTHERASERASGKGALSLIFPFQFPRFLALGKRENISEERKTRVKTGRGREGRPSRSALVKISSESASDKTRTHTHTHVHRRSIAVTALGNETIIVRVTLGDDALEPRAVNRTRLSAIDRYRFAPMSGGQVG